MQYKSFGVVDSLIKTKRWPKHESFVFLCANHFSL